MGSHRAWKGVNSSLVIWLIVVLKLRNAPLCSLLMAYEEEKSGVTEQEAASKMGRWQLPPDN